MAYGRMSSAGARGRPADFGTSDYVEQYRYGRSNYGDTDFDDCSSSRSEWNDCCGCSPSRPSTDEIIARKIESALERILSKYLQKIAPADNPKLNAALAELRSPSPTKQDATAAGETKLGFGLNDSAATPGSANEAVTPVGVAPTAEDAHPFG